MRLSIGCSYGKHSRVVQAAAGVLLQQEVQRPPPPS